MKDDCVNYSMNFWEVEGIEEYLDDYIEAELNPKDGVIFTHACNVSPSDSVEVLDSMKYRDYEYLKVVMKYKRGGMIKSRNVYMLADHANLVLPSSSERCSEYLNGCYIVKEVKNGVTISLCN